MKNAQIIALMLVALVAACNTNSKKEMAEQPSEPAKTYLTNDKLVEYPADYRNWTHVKSLILEPGHPLFDAFGGIHHVYANSSALAAMKNQTPYPDGSVLVFDLLETTRADSTIGEGERKVLGVMVKNAALFPNTGGWIFEGFKQNTRERVVTDYTTQCFNCHAGQKESDYVFSKFRM
jgi:hypothetical protein